MIPPDETAAAPGIVDFHNHLMPGVDDGARNEEEAKAGLRAMSASGVSTVIVTPHFDASLVLRSDIFEATLTAFDAAWARLNDIAAERRPKLERGAEVKLDTPEADFSDPRIRLAGGRFVLVEFPFFSVPPRSVAALEHAVARDYVPVVAHPERYRGIQRQLAIITEWKSAGAAIQVNGASLTGRYGEGAREAAVSILEAGLADYLCSDYHARGPTGIDDYIEAVEDLDGAEQAELLTRINPTRLLQGNLPLPVPPLPGPKTLWRRLAELVRRDARGS